MNSKALLQRWILSGFLVVSLLISGIPAVVQATPVYQPGKAAAANLTGYTYFSGLEVQNNDLSVLPVGYTVSITLDTAAMISGGRMRADCNDLRISFTDTTEVELDRLVSGCNTSTTLVKFRTQAAISSSSIDTRYTLNYGDPVAGTPPQNPANVYAYVDDFQDGNADGWTADNGIWSVVNETGNYFYRYVGEGTNWALAFTNVDASNIDYLAKVRISDTPNTNTVGLAFRIQDPENFLTFFQTRDNYMLHLAWVHDDTRTMIFETVSELTTADWYWMRVQAVGSILRVRAWADGSSEPGEWAINRTESTFQTNSNIGLTINDPTTNADWDDIQVRRLAAVEPTVTLSTWWDANYNFRRPLKVTNTSASNSMQQGFSTRFELDTAALITSGSMLPTCADLRVVYNPGLAPIEIDRVVENCNTSQTTVWFSLRRPIPTSGQDTAYTLYYRNILAGTPPANGMNVFLFYEDWEQTENHWINAGGLDSTNGGLGSGTMGQTVISDDLIGPISATHSQLFPKYGIRGDARSGYIPVLPSTNYAISVWGWSEDSQVCGPVGFDWYAIVDGDPDETWLWTDEEHFQSRWEWKSRGFTTTATANYLKIKSELWDGCVNAGLPPLYFDNIALRYAIDSAPALTLGMEDTTLIAPSITEIGDNGPVTLGTAAQVTANIATTQEEGIQSATLRIISPQVADVHMTLASGTTSDGIWQGNFTPNQGGIYTFQILASTGTMSRLSDQHTFSVNDSTPPVLSLVSVIDPIVVKNTQTLVVQATDNGALGSVTVTVEGSTRPMTASAGNQYSYSWQVATTGMVSYTVTATDTSNNQVSIDGSFVTQVREADVCIWKDCRQGAASWSIDDGLQDCSAELIAAGIRGTYFYNGVETLSWMSSYSAAGHEIGSHTADHVCIAPTCSPNCTEQSLAALPVVSADVQAYRLDQLEPNIAAIEAGTGKPVLSLAWPCGCTDPTRWQAASNYLLGARGYYDFIAGLTWLQDINLPTPTNIWNLNTANLFEQSQIDQAYAEGKWATVTSHNDCGGISYLGQLNTDGLMWVAPIGDVLKYIRVRDASQFSNYSHAERSISFNAYHNLTPLTPTSITTDPNPYTFLTITFDNPVTLKAHLLANDRVLGVTIDGNPVNYHIVTISEERYVTFDSALNTNHAVVVSLAAPAPTLSEVSASNPVVLGATATVNATVIPAPGTTLTSVTLHVISPESHDYPMTMISGNQYTATFTPAQIGTYSYQVIATNNEGSTSQSNLLTFSVSSPTAVTLATFTGKSDIHSVQLFWETANEVNLVGFNIYRSNSLDGAKLKLNSNILPARNPGLMIGAAYQLNDTVSSGMRYFYWLELIGRDGTQIAEPLVLTTNFNLYLPLLSMKK